MNYGCNFYAASGKVREIIYLESPDHVLQNDI